MLTCTCNSNCHSGHSSSGQTGQVHRGGWALPSTAPERERERERAMPTTYSQHRRTDAEVGDSAGPSRGKARATTTRIINID